MNIRDFVERANHNGAERIPFLFLIDFEMEKPVMVPLDAAAGEGLLYYAGGVTNAPADMAAASGTGDVYATEWEAVPVSRRRYMAAFDIVQKNLRGGNTYLLNLTFPTTLKGSLDLEALFYNSSAPYKLFKEDDFVLYSPESFIKIRDDRIFSFPMKGTISTAVPDAEKVLLGNKKEEYEHNTIVDLIRNDLAIVAHNIEVRRFRYIDKIKRVQNGGVRDDLLQISSEISGELDADWRGRFGDIIVKLLPAGSVSGAPKAKTCEIIREAEGERRGYYTGIFGIYDGDTVDSAVNIRFVERDDSGHFRYRSGGGITALSNCDDEYKELVEKVYVPAA